MANSIEKPANCGVCHGRPATIRFVRWHGDTYLNQVGMEFTEIRKEHGEDEYYRRAGELFSRYPELVVLYFRLGAAPLHQIVAE